MILPFKVVGKMSKSKTCSVQESNRINKSNHCCSIKTKIWLDPILRKVDSVELIDTRIKASEILLEFHITVKIREKYSF
jgi:hypothetical protein